MEINEPLTDFETYKRSLPLELIACRDYGYRLSRQKSSRKYRVLEREGSAEHILVSRNESGVELYFNPMEEADRGSIIDFLWFRCGKNWEQVRTELARLADLSANSSEAVVAPPRVSESPHFELVALRDRRFLHGRGISDETIDDPIFQQRIFGQENTAWGRKTYVNTAFPCYDAAEQVLGLEIKNKGFKAHALSSRKSESCWYSATEGLQAPLSAMVLTESALDALSYHQLFPTRVQRLLLSTGGAIAPLQIELIQTLVDRWQPNNLIVAFDRDAGGLRHSLQLVGQIRAMGQAQELSASFRREGQNRCWLSFDFGNGPQAAFRKEAMRHLWQTDERFSLREEGESHELRISFSHEIPLLKAALERLIKIKRLSPWIQLHQAEGKDVNEDLMALRERGVGGGERGEDRPLR